MSQSKNLLAIIARKDLFAKLAPFLKRGPLEVHRATEVATGLILAANVRYDLVVLEHPLPGAVTKDVLAALDGAFSRELASPVLLMGSPESQSEESPIDLGADRLTVVPQDVSENDLHQTISKLIGLKSRLSKRLLVQLEVKVEDGTVLRACQSRDLSDTGMFLRTSNPLPVGTVARASFSLPNDSRPFATTVRVVRHANLKKERSGMAIAHESIEPEDQERLRKWLKGEIQIYEDESPTGEFRAALAASRAGGI